MTFAYTEIEKNNPGLAKCDIVDEPRMYEQGGYLCPLQGFRSYLSNLLGGFDDFSRSPILRLRRVYIRVPVGKYAIVNFIRVISERSRLSKLYSNHYLWVTAMSVLVRKGHDWDGICNVSGHKKGLMAESLTPWEISMSNACVWRQKFGKIGHPGNIGKNMNVGIFHDD